jgi:hypothetical protein
VLTATPVGINTDAESSITVEFLTSLTPDQIYIDTDRLFEYATPGRPVSVYATVFNANGDELTDQQVEVSVNHGFLTPFADERRDLTPAQAPKVGDVYGYWKDLGDDEAETTDDSGNIANTVNIERDAGFDDDGEVTMTVTIKAGPVTEQREIDFNTLAEPLNPGSVSIELANPQSVEVLPNAPTTEAVYYDVVTKDQFANRTEDWVDVSDDSATAMLFERENWDENPDVLRLDPNPGAGYFDDFQGAWYDRVAADDSVRSNFTAEGPALAARSDAPATQKITGEWSSDQKNWVDTNDDKVADDLDQGNYNPKTVSDTTNAIKWYMINFAASKYSLGSGDSTRTIGDTVHSTFSAEDQMGEPIEDMAVKFFRTGPDDLQDGDGKDPVWTDSDGNASYIWQGAKAGKATVTSVVRTPDGALVPSAELSSTVTFAPRVAPKKAIAAKLTATNQRNGNDRLFVNAPSIAKTAKVTLYKVRKNGSLAKVSTARLNRNGNKTFVVKDVAKRAWTKYVAKVSATAKTKADTTPRKRVR